MVGLRCLAVRSVPYLSLWDLSCKVTITSRLPQPVLDRDLARKFTLYTVVFSVLLHNVHVDVVLIGVAFFNPLLCTDIQSVEQ